MKFLLTIFVAKAMNPRRTARSLKREANVIVEIVSELVELLHLVLAAIGQLILWIAERLDTKEQPVIPDNVINFADYMKKAAGSEQPTASHRHKSL